MAEQTEQNKDAGLVRGGQPRPLWSAHVLSLFPEMFPGPLGHSLAGRALNDGIWQLTCHHLRDFGVGRHKSVDGPACGGGVGLVMRPDAIGPALDHVIGQAGADAVRLYPSPRGRRLDQGFIRELAACSSAVFVCGRYEGLDQRIIDHYQLVEVSLGDYVLSGGEVAALTIMDGVVRLLDGVMGKAEGHQKDSFEEGLLEHPQYTAPRHWNGYDVPEILMSGHHQKIEEWKHQMAVQDTKIRRPDLWQDYCTENQRDADDKD